MRSKADVLHPFGCKDESPRDAAAHDDDDGLRRMGKRVRAGEGARRVARATTGAEW